MCKESICARRLQHLRFHFKVEFWPLNQTPRVRGGGGSAGKIYAFLIPFNLISAGSGEGSASKIFATRCYTLLHS